MPLSQYFRLADAMARMALRADATKLYLGYIWWILEPFLYVGVFYVVFKLILPFRQEDFLPFLMTGKLAYIWFSKTVTSASNSIVAGRGLVGKIDMPKTIFPFAVVQESLYKQITVFLLLFVVLIGFGYPVTMTWFYIIPIIFANYLMILACAYVGASLVCVVRDFFPLISLGMIFMMFTSGIFWNVRDLGSPEKTDLVLAVNPLAFILDAYRQALMYNTPPDMLHLLAVAVGFAALLGVMIIIMRRNSQFLALKALSA
jgi:homopolymeric O-antigen transport system permease protein